LPAEHYDKVLYPLQDKVVAFFKGTPFYLTGGTALSRGYFQHRYSDDLDYFVNDHPDFTRIVERQVARLSAAYNDLHVALRGDNFIRLFVGRERLKLEMINDVPAHIGALVHHPVLGMVDSKENILANKITALVDRSLPKDVVDIYVLLKDGLSIKQALLDAGSKAAGISPLLVAKILGEFNYSLLQTEIKWISAVSESEIRTFLTGLSKKIIMGEV
jgi:predicted nucleotidyltransferase component of viral defense system